MTRVGWLADSPGYIGGAELTQEEFRLAAPEGVEVVPIRPGDVAIGLDRYVIHNCVSYQAGYLVFDAPVFWYHHDVGPHISRAAWEALDGARHICVSPLQRERMGLDAVLIPPAVALEPFRKAAESAQERRGAVAVGPWMNPAKAPDAAAEWAEGWGGIDFYGGGPFAPKGSKSVSHDDMPQILARYEAFIHLPREIEPFGRAVVEAWAAGCEVTVNGLVGARQWIEKEPEKLDTATKDFWDLILNG